MAAAPTWENANGKQERARNRERPRSRRSEGVFSRACSHAQGAPSGEMNLLGYSQHILRGEPVLDAPLLPRFVFRGDFVPQRWIEDETQSDRG